jgi:two-component system, chemotaxis family, chemotaxis protein CheY
MKTILLADDSLFMRTALKSILEGRYEVREADNGAHCLELFEQTRPDLVLLDVVMPEGNEEGIRVLGRIMSIDPAAKVVMISALANQDAVVRDCSRLGAVGFIAKPFEEERVLSMVEDCLSLTPP